MTGADQTLTLRDGRTLGWATYGDPNGRPVVALHGSPDSRVIWRLVHEAALGHGLAVIAPDRPGFGLSTPKRGRSILDWVDDLDALTDHLDVDRYALLAISGGSPYALAAAWSHPERVRHVGLLSVIAPLHAPGVTRGANIPVRATFFAARRLPFLLRPAAAAMVRTTRRDPAKAARRMVKTRPPADRAIIERPEVMAVLMDNLPNQFADPESIALEMRNAARPWGFELSEVDVPVTIWQGGLDDVHTPAMGRYLDAHLPSATLVYEPDYATFNFLDDLDPVLGALADR